MSATNPHRNDKIHAGILLVFILFAVSHFDFSPAAKPEPEPQPYTEAVKEEEGTYAGTALKYVWKKRDSLLKTAALVGAL